MDEDQPQEVVEDQPQEVVDEQVEEQQEDVQADPEPEPEPQADPEPEPEAPADPEPEPEAQPEPEPEPEPEQKDEPQQAAPVEAFNGDLPADIESGCNDLYSDNPSFNWMITQQQDAKKGKDGLVVDSVGTGGLNELVEKCKQRKSDILFFCLRVNTYDNEGSSRAKFIYGRFVGSGVRFMEKAKLTPTLGQIADCFPVKHLSKDADESMKSWDAETLGKEFLRIGGAHKPSKYDFGPNAVYNPPK